MSKECKQGKEYKCPYREKCNSDRGGMHMCTTGDPIHIWTFAKDLYVNTKTWDREGVLYSCMPVDSIRTQTLYEQEIRGR